MKDEHLRILKTMHEATNRMDLNMLAQAVNLTASQVMEQLQELTKEGFLQKSDKGYRLSDKGRNALKITQTYPDKSFQFYVGIDKPLGFSAQSLEEFYRLVKQVCSDSIDFHLYRGDFESWIRDVLMDAQLADEVDNLKMLQLNGEELRKDLLKAIDTRYGVADLL